MAKAKIIGAAIAAILMLIVVLQNRAPVQTQLLFATVTMPRALLLFVCLVIGFVLGLATAGFFLKRGKPKAPK